MSGLLIWVSEVILRVSRSGGSCRSGRVGRVVRVHIWFVQTLDFVKKSFYLDRKSVHFSKRVLTYIGRKSVHFSKRVPRKWSKVRPIYEKGAYNLSRKSVQFLKRVLIFRSYVS